MALRSVVLCLTALLLGFAGESSANTKIIGAWKAEQAAKSTSHCPDLPQSHILMA